jgi:hypothetical protein
MKRNGKSEGKKVDRFPKGSYIELHAESQLLVL